MMTELKITGMGCQHCVNAVKTALEAAGVAYTEVGIGYAKIEGDVAKAVAAIEEAGYDVEK
ncbi:MAG TPA: cation transporter [Terriglobales bacterium]|nr:cation transporter [Terriglobales bacterium]